MSSKQKLEGDESWMKNLPEVFSHAKQCYAGPLCDKAGCKEMSSTFAHMEQCKDKECKVLSCSVANSTVSMDEAMEDMHFDDKVEYMEEVHPLSAYKLSSVTELFGMENAYSVVSTGLTVEFCNLIAKLCREIAILYELEERVENIIDQTGIQSFLFDVSAFLGELECPHESITCGMLEERFVTESNRVFLFNYLISEIKAARLHAVKRIETNKKSTASSLPTFVTTALTTLSVPKPNESVTLTKALQLVQQYSNKNYQCLSKPPQPLFQSNAMDESRWRQVHLVSRSLAQDCKSRHLILLKRMDVTVNSFLWSDRIRKQEERIRNLYSAQRDSLFQLNVPSLPALLSATDNLLRIETASSSNRRKNTRSTVKPAALSEVPADRGGRTDEMRGMKNKTRNEQREQFSGRGRDRHNFRGGPGRQISDESKTRNEYQDRNARSDD